MAVTAINNSEYGKKYRMSYFKAALFGGISAYTLKFALPVAPQEKDDTYKIKLRESNAKAREVKNAALEEIRKNKTKSSAEDKFIKMVDDNNLKLSKYKKLKNNQNILRKINDVGASARAEGRRSLNLSIKGLRPTGAFISAGIVIGLLTALITNIINKLAESGSRVEVQQD